MQINSKIFDFIPNTWLWILKNILFVGVLFSVYLLLNEKGENLASALAYIKHLPFHINVPIVLLLMPANWAFEAWKWQRLAARVEPITFGEAYQGVLAGLALATFTPLMIGDYAGKILMLKTKQRTAGIGAIFLGNSMQLYVSLLFGTMGYIYFIGIAQPIPLVLHIIIAALLAGLLITGVLLAFKLQAISFFNTSHSFIQFIKPYLIIIKEYSLPEIRDVFLIATGRYLIFSIQFLLVLQWFQINLPLVVLLAGISIIFLTKTVGAAFNFLGDLSLRAITSVYYFGYFGIQLSVITIATFVIWFLNVLVPILIGSLFILTLRFSARKAEVSAK